MMIYLPYFVCEFNVSVTCSNSNTLMLPDHFKHFVIDVLLTKTKALLLEEVSARVGNYFVNHQVLCKMTTILRKPLKAFSLRKASLFETLGGWHKKGSGPD